MGVYHLRLLAPNVVYRVIFEGVYNSADFLHEVTISKQEKEVKVESMMSFGCLRRWGVLFYILLF